jgi:NitT/TauT family transport system permease protein
MSTRRKYPWRRGFSLDYLKRVLYPVVTVIILLAIWEMGAENSGLSEFTLPLPSSVFDTISSNPDIFLEETLISTQFIILGYILGSLFGIGFALLSDISTIIDRATYPIFVVAFVVPKILLAPFFFLWFGAGTIYFTLVPMTLVFFPVLENTRSGLKTVPEDITSFSKIYQASTLHSYLRLRMPYAIPSVSSGLKIGIRQSVIGLIVAEFVIPSQGLGSLIIQGTQYGQATVSWAGVFIIALIGITFYKLVEILETYAVRWHNGGLS